MSRLLVITVLCSATLAHATNNFEFSNKPGPYTVGLKVHQQYDRSRVYKTRISLITGKPTEGERARPMQILVWYPAQNGGKVATFRDYLSLGATEGSFTYTQDEVRRVTDQLLADRAYRMPEAIAVSNQRMWAFKDAPEENGKFPVLIYAPSASASAAENPDLCEYLASQGYIVISSPSQGAHTRGMTINMEGLETQVADIAYLMSFAASLPQANIEKIAVAGYSWGGLANVVAAAKDNRIKALISLDGSVRYFPQLVDGRNDAVPYVDAAKIPIPFLYLARRPPSIEELNQHGNSTQFSLINKMTYADVLIVTMHAMSHADFGSRELRLAPDSDFSDYTRAEVSKAYGSMAQYVHKFLDAYLKNDPQARDFIVGNPVNNGVPAHMITVDLRTGSGVPPTREAFAKQLATRGFDKAAAIYKEMKEAGASFTLDSNDINRWGYELLRGGMATESVDIFRFGTQIFPADANLFDSLGEALTVSGRREEAIQSYQRSLALDAANTNAIERLKLLKVTVKDSVAGSRKKN